MKNCLKRVIALALLITMISSNVAILVSAEGITEPSAGNVTTKTLYRYREKIVTTSRIPLEEPWIFISRTSASQLYGEYSNLNPSRLADMEEKYSADYYYTKKVADGTICKFSTQPNGGTIYYYEESFLEGPYGMYDETQHTYYKHPTTGNKLYLRDVCTTYKLSVYTKYEYQYWKWSEWSAWSEEPCESSETVEVETKESNVVYRFRKKQYTTSKTSLDEPWILYNTTTEYEHIGSENHYLKITESIDESYCVHKKEVVTQYLNKYGNPFYLTTDELIDYLERYPSASITANGNYVRYTCCTSKKPYSLYHYYTWGEWSEWSYTPVEPDEETEVETKIAGYVVISYDANGGIGAPAPTKKDFGETITLSTEAPTRTGHQFLGWSTDPKGDVVYGAGAKYSIDADIVLYAVWKINTYTIHYDANGGNGGPQSQTKVFDEDLILSDQMPEREGYYFLGWSTSADGIVTYVPEGTYVENNSVTLYAVWELKTYTITYNANGGTDAPSSQTKVHGADFRFSEQIPIREGHSFSGWAITANGSPLYQPGDTYTDNASVTLYAVWDIDTYAVVYNVGEGNDAPAAQTKAFGTDLILSAQIPKREGFTFVGWAINIDGSVVYAPGDTYTGNCSIVLYAVWEINTYTISYDANGGFGAPTAQKKVFGTDLTLSNQIPEQDGYNFVGWATSADGSVDYAPGSVFVENSDITLYAVWELKTYTITYNANGGENAPEAQIKFHNVLFEISDQQPIRLNYGFLGWSTSATGEVVYQPGDKISENNNFTLYAVWKPGVYTVIYDANGGIGAPDPVIVDGGISHSISDVVPTREGFTFLGWSTHQAGNIYSTYSPYGNKTYLCSNWRESDGGIGSYTSNDVYSGGTDITLYAVWRVNNTSTLGNKCGDNLYWSYNKDELCLTITGYGPMYNFVDAPWKQYSSKIKTVVLPEGIESIGNNAFCYSTVGNLTIPKTVVSIGSAAFMGDTGLKTLVIPSTVKQICFSAFSNCDYLTDVSIECGGLVDTNLFNGCDRLSKISITGNITRILSGAFADCGGNSAIDVDLPQSLCWITAGSIRNTKGTHILYDGTQNQWSTLSGTKLSNVSLTCNRYEIIYDANGGVMENVVQTKMKDADVYLISNIPTKDGFKFNGWSTTANGVAEYSPLETYSENQDITLYAVWEATKRELSFAGAALTLYDNISVGFKVDKALLGVDGFTDPYVVFTFNGVETKVSTYTTDGDRYVFTFSNIAPNQMNDTISATLYATYGGVEYTSETKEYSVATYCYNMLSKCSGDEYAEFRTLLVDLLCYGAMSQTYTGYNTGALANVNLTAAQKAWGTSTDRQLESVLNPAYATIAAPTVTMKGAGLNLEDAVTVRLKFAAASTDGLTLKIVTQSGIQYTISADKFEKGGDVYYAYFNGLNAGQMSETIYMTFYKDGAAVSNTAAYSIESYAVQKQADADVNLVALLKAMMRYGDAAYAYVN